MELKDTQEKVSFKQDENSTLLEQLDTVRLEAKEKLSKLHQLESVVEEMKTAQEQNGCVFEELKSSQLSVVSLEHQLKNSRQQFKVAQMEQQDLEREGDDLRCRVIALKSEHEQQVYCCRF